MDFTHVGAKSLYLALRSCHYLKTLILDRNKLGGPSTSMLQVMLLGTASLTTLSMNSCKIRDEGFSSICDGLERTTTLKSLSLSNNSISDSSVKSLSKKFSIFSLPLKHLDLSHNSITYKSGVSLMESLASNRHLQSFIVNNNDLRDESAQELIQTLKKNKVLRRVNLNFNSINIRFLEEIEALISKNEMLAIEKILPDFQREIKSMACDRRDFDRTTKDLMTVCINKAATQLRVKSQET